jgi:enamine deaminase RidA (YjgF/YER057c/UK114 family)
MNALLREEQSIARAREEKKACVRKYMLQACIPLQLLSTVRRSNTRLSAAVNINDMLGNVIISKLVALVKDNEEEIEAGEDWSGQIDVCFECFRTIVAAEDWVSGS